MATNRDATYPADGGRMMPGAGSLVAALETCSGKVPHNSGKPSAWFVELVKSLVGDHSAVMIGDRLDTDVAFGKLAGFKTLLVTETGVHTAADAEAAAPEKDPIFRSGVLQTF